MYSSFLQMMCGISLEFFIQSYFELYHWLMQNTNKHSLLLTHALDVVV